MSRKKKPPTVVKDGEVQWNDDDFNLDSHGVEAPERDVFEMFSELGMKPDEVNAEARERYVKYLERRRKKKEEQERKVGKAKEAE